jgi:hypothetical protein
MKKEIKEIEEQFRVACFNVYSQNMGGWGHDEVSRLKDKITRAWPIRRRTLSRIEIGVLLRICSGKVD